jgi:hypothetical protein
MHGLDDVRNGEIKMPFWWIPIGRSISVPGLNKVTSERAPVFAAVSAIRASEQT